eukprot:scaffold13499_cov207-Alexandrium_tamarense.AAC.5
MLASTTTVLLPTLVVCVANKSPHDIRRSYCEQRKQLRAWRETLDWRSSLLARSFSWLCA